MTEPLYYEDAYLKECDAQVIAVHEEWIELDRTVFYPQGGGQPGDTGQLARVSGARQAIVDTRKGEAMGSILHRLERADHGIVAGERVRVCIDWERRYKHMQMHTAMHLLGSLIPVPVTGGAIGSDKSRLDFDLGDHRIDKEELTAGIVRLIAEDHPLRFEAITEQELDEKPELVRTMSVQPPRGAGSIRMVRVTDVDFQPCGGTHVSRTGEIAPVRVSKIENKGRQNRRVHLAWDQG